MRITIVVAMMAGCVSQIPLAAQEQCAENGMFLDGIALSSGEASAVAYGRGGTAYGRGYSAGESLSCRRPQTLEERCEIQAASATARIKDDWNPVVGKNAAIALGYLILVFPGIAASIYYVGAEHSARDRIRDAYVRETNACMGVGPPPVASDPADVQPGPEGDTGYCYVASRGDGKAEFRCSSSAELCQSRFEHADAKLAGCRHR